MSRPVHFEIHASDPARACTFYGDALGWTFEDWSEYAGSPYFGVTTGPEDAPGIDGAIMQRTGDPPAAGAPVRGAVLTVGCEDFDVTAGRILAAGGEVALEKHALPGMAWQGYFLDTEGNVFGLHQPDPRAGEEA
ncbi:VOC family protein [Dietzia kunjamensis]|uniref:VOC family protein n=1 Tax=Dietzia kunjamensis TaxID=322509 RepID=UPI0020979D68|nr:VOC family protein [Dietzia kunjamensis]USX44570.1 VOC family protein [Dietzia kunjamensis]